MPINFNGLASGLNTDQLITDLVRFSQRRIDTLKSREQVETSRQTSLKGIETRIQTLQTQMAKLGRPQGSVFDRKTVSSSEAGLVTAAAGSTATAGTTSLRVLGLAQKHQIASQGFDDPTAEITQGTFEIQSGGKTATITIDSTNNTVRGLAQAIGNANIGITASVISDGSDARTQPYRLLLSAKDSGSENAITITNNLAASSGGAMKPNFGSTQLGTAIAGSTFQGTSSLTSNSGAGTFTGTSNDTFNFTVVAGGTVGTDNGIQVSYSNQSGSLTGTITVDQADVGVDKSVASGVQVQFGAGTLVAGDTFSVDGFVPTVQAATNAQVQLGTGSGAIVVQSASNVVNDLVPGVTLNLLSADPAKEIKITVADDIAAAKQDVTDFVADYNDFIDFIDKQTRFNVATGTAAILNGNRSVTDLKTQIERSVLAVSGNLPSSINRIGAVGITSDGKGKLEINEAKLNDVLNGRIAGVGFPELKKLFALAGTSSSTGIQFATGTKLTKESGSTPYQIDITQAAERATISATNTLSASTVIDGSNNSLVVRIDEATSSTITLASGTYSQVDLARQVESQINAIMVSQGKQVSVSLSSQRLSLTSSRYGSKSEATVVSGSALASLGFDGTETDRGVDVAGSFLVNNVAEAATGSGQVLTGAVSNTNTSGLATVVTLTQSQLQVGVDATLSITRGMASRLDSILQDMLDPVSGNIQKIDDRFQASITDATQRTSKETFAMDEQRTALVRQFASLETTMSNLRAQGDLLTRTFGAGSNSN
ncbi:MAG: flagellar filament capping protein FliD [Planctomycetales bacterium]|nr:flagellar filament capping protein FliD [Planctomycetales bacterium]